MLIATLLTGITAHAHDFEAQNNDGVTIYYNIISSTDKTCKVTYAGDYYSSYSNEYAGSIIIPETVTYNGTTYSVTSIGYAAFEDCSGLTSVTIGNSVTSIGDFAFSRCTGLTTIKVETGNSKYDSRNNCNAIIETESNTLIVGCMNTNIPNSVTSIGDEAFSGCSGLTSITIPNSVTSIGDQTFYDCSGLTSVTIPNSVTSIGNSAFNSCSGLTSISIGNSVTNIGGHAFYGCSGLTSITIGNRVTNIGDYAFYGNYNIQTIACKAKTPPTCGTNVFNSIIVESVPLTVPKESVSLYQSADTWKDFGTIKGIAGSSALTYNILNETDVEVIGGTEKYTGDIVIPSQTTIDGKVYNVTQIGDAAFQDCTNLTNVKIGNSVTRIGELAFYQCYSKFTFFL